MQVIYKGNVKALKMINDWSFWCSLDRSKFHFKKSHVSLLQKVVWTGRAYKRDGRSNVCNVILDEIWSTKLSLSAEMCGLGVSSEPFLALSIFLA